MTVNFDTLVQVALLGTDRQPPPEAQPADSESLLGTLQQQAQSPNKERTLLSLAALTGVYERVGRFADRTAVAAQGAAPVEVVNHASGRASDLLMRLLNGEFRSAAEMLLGEWLSIAALTKQIPAPEALPRLLELGSNSSELRVAIQPALGERGLWLAKQNPAWAWAYDTREISEAIWETGEPLARFAYLRHLRAEDPAKGRELLATTWKQESTDDRARFLHAFQFGLSGADEEFLEKARADKRKEVREIATTLLARIPASAYAVELKTRALSIVQFVPAKQGHALKLKRSKPALVEVHVSKVDEELQKLLLTSKAPKGIGDKAWLVIQFLQLLPLQTWTDAWNVSPDEIVSASVAGEWKADLLEAWIRAAVAQRNNEWADVLFPAAFEAQKVDHLFELQGIMSAKAAEENLLQVLEAKDENVRALQAPLLAASHGAWSITFSRAVLAWLRQLTADDSSDWQTRNSLVNFVPRFSPEVLPETSAGWPTESKGWDFWRSGVDDTISAAQFRDEMIRALHERK